MKRMLFALLLCAFSTTLGAHIRPDPQVIEKALSQTYLIHTDTSLSTGVIIDDGVLLSVSHVGSFPYVASKPRDTLRSSIIYDLQLVDVPELKGKTKLGGLPKPGDEVMIVSFHPVMKRKAIFFGRVVLVEGADIIVDAAAYPGNSGGGVYNEKGELVGLVYSLWALCEDFCRPLTVVRSSAVIKVFLSQGE